MNITRPVKPVTLYYNTTDLHINSYKPLPLSSKSSEVRIQFGLVVKPNFIPLV